jgi:hypothetical protein
MRWGTQFNLIELASFCLISDLERDTKPILDPWMRHCLIAPAANFELKSKRAFENRRILGTVELLVSLRQIACLGDDVVTVITRSEAR